MTVQVPKGIVPLDNILPDEPLLMMGAGPVPIPERVAHANSIVINHLGDTMAQVIEQVKNMSCYVFQTESRHILGVAGPGSAAMEMAVVNLIRPGDNVLSICNGFFSGRLAEMAERSEAKVLRMQVADGECAMPDEVEKYIKQHNPRVITMVQGETSNTVYNRYLPEIGKLARQYDCLLVVDAVCTLSTMPLDMDDWGVDAVITGGQKGLSSIPGVSLVAFSDKAWAFIESRSDRLRHWCLDARLADQFWYKKSYHYTAPVSGILAMHEALRLVCNETLSVRYERHLKCSIALQASLEALGVELYVQPESRLNSVVGILTPPQMDRKILLKTMSERYRVEIAGSFGPPIVRIGQMGEQCRAHNLFRTIHAFGSSMNRLGAKVDLPAAMATLESHLENES
ncbi:MAG: alanine--glyoxylate aminotransferase family protein [Gammaproteobacteria bacterium]|nr:alanine--glyoxylate aminotransferase family protein [Gammaproteobacteria bacterium]